MREFCRKKLKKFWKRGWRMCENDVILAKHCWGKQNNRARQDMERYRSGHNEAVLKTVCPQGHVGSNPTLSVWWQHLMKKNSKEFFFYSIAIIFLEWFEQLYFGEVPKLAEGTPLERVQVVNSGAGVQIPPSPFVISLETNAKKVFQKNCKNLLTNVKPHDIIYKLSQTTEQKSRKKQQKNN